MSDISPSLWKFTRYFCFVPSQWISSIRLQGMFAKHIFPLSKNECLNSCYDREELLDASQVSDCDKDDRITAWSVEAIKPILDKFDGVQDLSMLDVGCRCGTRLELAANLGWQCFGVEESDRERLVAQKRLEGRAHIVATVADLIPHEFDLILLLDVIEQLSSPYTLLYSLFSKGAIKPKTLIIIFTHDSGSDKSRQNPTECSYLCPPSHLVYYSAESLRFFLEKLHFSNIDVQRVHSLGQATQNEAELARYGWLLFTATGSDFTAFMQERYVPGTWSKIAEYEHLPRYALAKTLATDKQVLDFGCGTGYGSAMLAEVAANVTGLDIDAQAHNWARSCHNHPRLSFHLCDDLGTTLPPKSFDLVTCFEMIEHVDHAVQRATIASIARLLRDDGILLISTPNPEVTELYGENPYHLREMTEDEFKELLTEFFPHVSLLKQKVRISISFAGQTDEGILHTEPISPSYSDCVQPLAFVAVCSKGSKVECQPTVVFDDKENYILDFTSRETKLHKLQSDVYRLKHDVSHLYEQVRSLQYEVAERDNTITVMKNSKKWRTAERLSFLTRLFAKKEK